MTIARDLQQDPDGTATTSEIAEEGKEGRGALVLPRDVFNDLARHHNQEAKNTDHESQLVSTVHGGSSVDEEGRLVYKQPRVHTIPSDTSSSLSPPPTMEHGGSQVSFPSKTQRQTTEYGGSILGFPPSALPEDPFSVPRTRAGIIARRYIQSEENPSKHGEQDEEEGGMEETRRVYTPIPRKFEISDSEDDAMTEVERGGRIPK
jgi:hypothetical protein